MCVTAYACSPLMTCTGRRDMMRVTLQRTTDISLLLRVSSRAGGGTGRLCATSGTRSHICIWTAFSLILRRASLRRGDCQRTWLSDPGITALILGQDTWTIFACIIIPWIPVRFGLKSFRRLRFASICLLTKGAASRKTAQGMTSTGLWRALLRGTPAPTAMREGPVCISGPRGRFPFILWRSLRSVCTKPSLSCSGRSPTRGIPLGVRLLFKSRTT
eukprot:Rmarinus@m.6547